MRLLPFSQTQNAEMISILSVHLHMLRGLGAFGDRGRTKAAENGLKSRGQKPGSNWSTLTQATSQIGCKSSPLAEMNFKKKYQERELFWVRH